MNPEHGLSQTEMNDIFSVLNKYDEVLEAILFGSRAKGNYRNSSDVDIALVGNNIDQKIVLAISYQLNEELLLPYQFDILNFQSIKNTQLIGHIKRVGISIYTKNNIFDQSL